MVLCYVYEGMADFEITLLLHRLRNTGRKEVVAISESLSPIKAQSGLSYLPDRQIDEINVSEAVEALIIPGGPINNQQNAVLGLIRDMVGNNKLVAAICFAPQFLGRAGILDHYQFTTSCSTAKISELGCRDPFNWKNHVEKRVVTDRHVITAKGYAFVDFAVAVSEYLNIFKDEDQKYEQLGRIKEHEKPY